jgi:hypothetical protein
MCHVRATATAGERLDDRERLRGGMPLSRHFTKLDGPLANS